ncbi:hypothetical protein McpSp1_01070 [Methanocorpusculaceae archaeon Sp1]|nr:hypothetical protein [Methanocorpusculaceae archaeon Sp1]
MTEKHEWRKEDKTLYLPKNQPELITIPAMKFFMVKGVGDPNTSQTFADHIGLLYSLSYAVRMMPKQGFTPEGYAPYTVYPLEGVWGLVNPELGIADKSNFSYTLMIRQPEFVTDDVISRAKEVVRKKNPDACLDEVIFDELEEGLAAQMLHIGPYDDEPASFARLAAFLEENHLERTSLLHREIYISDARKSDPAKQKTVLRWTVRKKEV